MNKTISINIAGFVFNIEEQAYEKLSNYLESIKDNFRHEADCTEIMEDIEARIAELFQENLSDRKEVIVEKDVEEVINIMGKPEDYVAEETADNFTAQEENNSESTSDSKQSDNDYGFKAKLNLKTNSKRLFRDENNGHIGGVCQGLGWFFGIDPTLVRLGFILLTILGGSGVLIYLILWIVVPQAKTTAEILEMQGEPINLGSIKDHVKGMKDDIQDSSRKASKQFKRAVNRTTHNNSQLLEVVSKIVGGIFVITGISALFVLVVVFFTDSGLLPFVSDGLADDIPTILELIYPSGRSILVFIAIALVTVVPIISMIVLGMKMLLNIKYRLKEYSIIASVIWILSAGTLVITGIELGMQFKNQAELDFEVPVEVDSTEVIYIDVEKDDKFSDFIEYYDVWNYSELVNVGDDKIYLGYPELVITESTDSNNFSAVLYKESNGKYLKEAIHKSEDIQYEISSTQNQLMLAPYFSITRKEKMRNQKVTLNVNIPQGKKVKFGPNIDRIKVNMKDGHKHYPRSLANTIWTPVNGVFTCEYPRDHNKYLREFEDSADDD